MDTNINDVKPLGRSIPGLDPKLPDKCLTDEQIETDPIGCIKLLGLYNPKERNGNNWNCSQEQYDKLIAAYPAAALQNLSDMPKKAATRLKDHEWYAAVVADPQSALLLNDKRLSQEQRTWCENIVKTSHQDQDGTTAYDQTSPMPGYKEPREIKIHPAFRAMNDLFIRAF